MNKITLLTSIAGLACAMSAQASFGTVNIQSTAFGGADGGGAFLVKASGFAFTGNDPRNVGYSADQFLTFCLELSENITIPGTYRSQTSLNAVKGGGGPNPDPISLATAWLYKEFAAGTLDDNVATFSYAGNTGANNLQKALWFLEQELLPNLGLDPVVAPGAAYKYLVDAAMSAVGIGLGDYDAARTTLSSGQWGVRALNLYTTKMVNGVETIDKYNQTLLAIVPEPSTYIAGGLALLPLLFGLRARFQRK
jgi:hypothetical protein